MDIDYQKQNEIHVFAFSGDVIHSNCKKIETLIQAKIEDESVLKVLFNFDQVFFVDSSGIGLLGSFMKTVTGRQGKLAICNVREKTLKLFKIAHVDSLLNVYPNQEAAVDYLES